MFDTIRNTVKISGKRLFWSHMKVLIVALGVASTAKALYITKKDTIDLIDKVCEII
ncbi:hypothetical protein G9F72_006055 [Clostridium estertheticum]|uniref:hypothetical protein n=1 Tax=Clostridium estertheticum TaxID=238834 RepID=UPI0013E9679E|nr:hypothetical protein [Clostridium estertheticum]MBZ9685905.1 hypothetical protein [Clostridium estertheticum]